MISNCLDSTDDINRVSNKFYADFNTILRRFHFTETHIKIYLFRQYCLQFYGADLWIHSEKSKKTLKRFQIGYHKAIKKLLEVSMHESNHYACQEANILMFDHLMNKIKISALHRFLFKPCMFIYKASNFFKISSVLHCDVRRILREKYQVDSLLDNDIEAIIARISYTQNHESQMRTTW